MGVDCKILIPSDARIKDIANVIGLAAGCSKEKVSVGIKDSFFVKVHGVSIESTGMKSMVDCAQINIKIKTIDGESGHYVLSHLEPSGQHGQYKLIMPRSTPFWIAIGKKLVDFFGGTLDYNDCDSIDVDYKRDKPREWNDPSDGEEWDDFEKEMFKIKPITPGEYKKALKVASYKIGIDKNYDPNNVVVDPDPEAPEKVKENPIPYDDIVDAMEKMSEGVQ